MKTMFSKNSNPLPPELERAASERFGKHVSPQKALVTLIFSLLTAASPMLLGLRLWDRIPSLVETGLIGPGGTDDSMPRAVLVFGVPGLFCVLNAICHGQLWLHQKASRVPPSSVRLLGRWSIPVISVLLSSFWIALAAGEHPDLSFYLPCALALLLILLGAHFFDCSRESKLAFHLSRIEHWEGPWRKTHRLAGVCWMLAGLQILMFWFLFGSLPWYSMVFVLLLTLSEFPAAMYFSK
ncbi:MAG: SdpI family protein [Oscillospiraceae bacterium]|nr:SdpI family protein [Oscillospiraceae bacterium]